MWRDNMFAQCLIYIVFLALVSFFSFYLVWYLLIKRNKILNTYMHFLCECMKIDCEIDCDARGLQLRSYLGHQIAQCWHCLGSHGGFQCCQWGSDWLVSAASQWACLDSRLGLNIASERWRSVWRQGIRYGGDFPRLWQGLWLKKTRQAGTGERVSNIIKNHW